MASFDFDQAEGLRRMLAGPKPRIFTFLSAAPDEEKSAMLVNLGISLFRAGNAVVLVDARSASRGVAAQLEVPHGATLQDVARQERALNEAIHPMPQGFCVATLTSRGNWRNTPSNATSDKQQAQQLANVFGLLAAQADILLIDGELDASGAFPLAVMEHSEIVVQVSGGASSIKAAYSIVKQLNAQSGHRSFGILVTGVTEQEAQVVYDNMAKASKRYLAVQLSFLGSVPADEHVKRAARLGRSVVDAYPLAGASVAFKRLAGRVSASERTSGLRDMAAIGANLAI
ncbi:MAG: MinD/ParA family protein [Burkholderiales bacterium]